MSNLINKSECKKFALAYAKANRSHKFNAVSAKFLDEVEAQLRLMIGDRIQRHPSKGKTIMGHTR